MLCLYKSFIQINSYEEVWRIKCTLFYVEGFPVCNRNHTFLKSDFEAVSYIAQFTVRCFVLLGENRGKKEQLR